MDWSTYISVSWAWHPLYAVGSGLMDGVCRTWYSVPLAKQNLKLLVIHSEHLMLDILFITMCMATCYWCWDGSRCRAGHCSCWGCGLRCDCCRSGLTSSERNLRAIGKIAVSMILSMKRELLWLWLNLLFFAVRMTSRERKCLRVGRDKQTSKD